MGIITDFFCILLSLVIINAVNASIIYNTSNIEQTHKSILADINNKLELNRTIRGKPDQDYPIHSTVPATTFSCIDKPEGYFSDTESRCQAFRICANTATSPQGFGFLCPNGTLFNQKYLVCDWYRNVKCNDSELYYNNNVQLGTEINVMNTIRLIMEYPIKMLKGDYTHMQNFEKSYDTMNQAAKQENYLTKLYDYKNPNQNNRSSLLINNLGELSPDSNINYENEDNTIATNIFQNSTINDINLAININNLAETVLTNRAVYNESDISNKQAFRFLSHEFSNQKQQNKAPNIYEKTQQSAEGNSLYDNNQIKYLHSNKSRPESLTNVTGKNKSTSNDDSSEFDVEYASSTSNAPQEIDGNTNSSIDAAKFEELNGNSEYVQKYSSNLLISGIIQTSLEPKIYQYNKTMQSQKIFKNFFNKRNLQQTVVTTPKLSTPIRTKNPRVPFKQSVANDFISQMTSTYKSPTLENLPISNNGTKKSIRNIVKETTNAVNTRIINNNTNEGFSASTYQPTWESVRKNLMRYEIPNADLLQKEGYSSNTKKTPSKSIVATNQEEQSLTLENIRKGSSFHNVKQNIKHKSSEMWIKPSFRQNFNYS